MKTCFSSIFPFLFSNQIRMIKLLNEMQAVSCIYRTGNPDCWSVPPEESWDSEWCLQKEYSILVCYRSSSITYFQIFGHVYKSKCVNKKDLFPELSLHRSCSSHFWFCFFLAKTCKNSFKRVPELPYKLFHYDCSIAQCYRFSNCFTVLC